MEIFRLSGIVLILVINLASCVDVEKCQKEFEINKNITREQRVLNDQLFVKPSSSWKIFPGTKWCGDGTKATSWDDLGRYRDTDMCCREHDACPWMLRTGQSRWGLKNDADYTRSHCMCDWRFYKCLQQAGGAAAFLVRTMFFKFLKPKCFHQELPMPNESSCVYKGKSMQYKSTCLFYEMDAKSNIEIPMRWREIMMIDNN